MEVAFIHPSWPGSEGTGATHSATQIVEGLADHGHSVDVFCTEPIPNDVDVENFKVLYLPPEGRAYHYQYNQKLNHAIRNRIEWFNGYDVIHSYLTTTIPAMEWIGQKTDAATVVTLNAYSGVCPKNDLLYLNQRQCTGPSLAKCTYCSTRTSFGHDQKGPLHRTASRLANLELIRESKPGLKHVDAFRAPSGHIRRRYANFGFSPRRIHVIPHPLNPDFLVEHVSRFEEPYRLLYVGFLKEKKGVNRLIPIISRLREITNSEFTLSVVGEGPCESHMRRQADNYNVNGIVEFKGFVANEELPETYAAHDLFLYPSLWEEPLGRVYLEALATGTPIISSSYGDIKSIMGEGGITVEGDNDAFARKIAQLFQEESLAAISESARDEATRYRRDHVVSRIESMYKSII